LIFASAVSNTLEHLNKDASGQARPFILAGHSQGSNLLLMLLERRFGDAALREQLVAAYVIGWSVTAEDMQDAPPWSRSAFAVAAIRRGASFRITLRKWQAIGRKQ